MVQHELRANTYTCPDCGNKLASERDLLHCKEHGAFFVYGPQLVVRAPRQNTKVEALLPWERQNAQPA